jgi:signal transduction histidine kinase
MAEIERAETGSAPGAKLMNRILVIDDEEWLREMVNLALSKKGFDVVEAENGAEGIEVARRVLPDLVLCDVNMAKVDGYLTLAALRSEPRTATIPFILMTGLADNEGMRHGMELGADDYLPKPFTLNALYKAVDVRLNKVRTVRSEAEQKLAELRTSIATMLPHELRTPLNGIVACSEILSTEGPQLPGNEVAEMGRMIHDSSKRLERLIENFLIYAQLELIAHDPQRLSQLQRSVTRAGHMVVAAQARAQARKHDRTADLSLELSDGPVAISEEYLNRIVAELVGNAFKFSGPNTPVLVSFASEDQGSLLSVADRGRGFSAEHIARVGAYMQFDRKLQEQQGQGLGLAIARRLIELHHGSFSLEPRREGGTVVAARFPPVVSASTAAA